MKYVLTSIISAIIGAAVLYWYMPQNSTEIITKDRIVTIIKRIKNADGSEVVEEKKTEDKTETNKSKEIKKDPDWHISIGSDLNRVIKLDVNRRVLGPITIGVYATTDKNIGASIGILF